MLLVHESLFHCCALQVQYFLLTVCFCPVMSVGMEKPPVVEQVDLTPTLALGLGLPISQNSVGRVIPGVLEEATLRDQLRFLHLNGHQLSCLLKDSVPDYEKGGLHIGRVHPPDSSKAIKTKTLPDRLTHRYAVLLLAW